MFPVDEFRVTVVKSVTSYVATYAAQQSPPGIISAQADAYCPVPEIVVYWQLIYALRYRVIPVAAQAIAALNPFGATPLRGAPHPNGSGYTVEPSIEIPSNLLPIVVTSTLENEHAPLNPLVLIPPILMSIPTHDVRVVREPDADSEEFLYPDAIQSSACGNV